MSANTISRLPVAAAELETALHAVCDAGHWHGVVRAVHGDDGVVLVLDSDEVEDAHGHV